MTLRQFRRSTHQFEVFIADLGAATKGPEASARRYGRRRVYRASGSLGRAVSRALGLQR